MAILVVYSFYTNEPADTGEVKKERHSPSRLFRNCSEIQKLSIKQGGTATKSPLRVYSLVINSEGRFCFSDTYLWNEYI